jgi:predicted Zn-dependent protease
MASAIVALGVGATQLVRAAPYLGSREQMWWSALRRDGAHERAIEELARPLRAGRKPDDLAGLADRCLRTHPLREAGEAPLTASAAPRLAQVHAGPVTCACLALRAEANLRLRAAAEALRDAQAVVARCADRKGSRAAVAEALAMAGRTLEAEQEVKVGLSEGGDPAQLRYALALAYERAGRYPEATLEATRAIDAGAGREARLLAGALAIVANDLDGAARWLEPLVAADPSDADARYNLALIADRRGDYNGARQGYLATLKIDPRSASARYNLALLTLRAGVIDEARHHARKFVDMFPDDPRGPPLARTVAAPPSTQRSP